MRNVPTPMRWALFAAIAVAGYWLLQAREVDVASTPRPDPQVAAAPAAVAVAPPVDSPADVVSRSAVAAAEGLEVFVTDPEGRPVEGAVIRVTGEDAGIRFPKTGVDGVARADRFPSGEVYLYGSDAGRSGLERWNWGAPLQRQVRLRLQPDREVDVLVRDPLGAPLVATRVELTMANGDLRTDRESTTDEHGRARIAVPGSHWLAAATAIRGVATSDGKAYRSEPTPWNASGTTSLAIVAERAVERGVVLKMWFTERDGQPASVRGTVRWSRINTSPGGVVVWPAGEALAAGDSVRATGLLDADHLRVTLSELGRLEVTVDVQLPTGRTSHEIVLARGESAPVLEIPLVDAGGQPMRAGDFTVFVRFDASAEHTGAKLQPDAAGVLRLVLPETGAGKVEVAFVRRDDHLHWPAREALPRPYYTSVGPPLPPDPAVAVLAFPAIAAGSVHRVPPVAVNVPSPRLRGRVVDTAGRPVAGVRIGLTSTTTPEPAPFALFATRTDAAGEFTIHATQLPDELFVFGRQPHGFCAPLRVRPVDSPVQLTLQPTGGLAMSVQVPEPVRAAVDRLRVRPQLVALLDEPLRDGWWGPFRRSHDWGGRGELRDRWHVTAFVPETGEFELSDLLPGTYELRGFLGDTQVLALRGWRVVAGETTRAPGPGGVLDGVEATCVRVRGAAGAPLAGAQVRFTLAEWQVTNPGGQNQATDANGEAWFLVPRHAVADVEVVAAGLAPWRQNAVRFPLDVVVGAGTSLDVALTGHQVLAGDVRCLVVSCRVFDGVPPDSPLQNLAGMQMLHHPQATVDGNGRCTIPNLPPGRYRVWLAALPPLGDRSGRGTTFFVLGDHTVLTDGPRRLDITRQLTEADLATLRGR